MNKHNKTAGILFLDDSLPVLEMMSRHVEKWGYTAYRAKNAQKALSLVKENPDIKVCFIDLNLGANETNGFYVIRDLRAQSDPNRNLKVVLLTAAASKNIGEIASSLGADSYLTKPIGSGKLRGIIESFLAEG
ncbi:response regulator [Pseudobacteriovorax antillogorgiicola]|uniref:Response regulator receiver domain-containing protein n=1 Tax=Pseudobacteriovorax antillogorgiicola TaxID=1513793 RepID=A0A1Y6BCJ8_9BACT|nr:response regulator [Pseudobacteriovorax antillogorgiicola]TCS58548.1 response regulator receiver domain-containing protein [Pseudobacteriovorax antillogorgiicola]SME97740.1 Response regulator receiver domain-containing protein [Pseudobacteriovorax antillogorgiicola]